MKRLELERQLNRKAKIVFVDGDVEEGILKKSSDDEFKNNYNINIFNNYYLLLKPNKETGSLFRLSHVKKISAI